MRLIDADALPKYTGYALSATEVAKAVESAPTVDAVEVVRCKDCWYSSVIPEEMQYYGEWHCEYWGAEMHGNEFCSCGKERKRDENA